MFTTVSNLPWMPRPPRNSKRCPPGLEYLAVLDKLTVHQKEELFEILVGYETTNKYAILNSLGQGIYCAFENSNCCSRNFFGHFRPFTMKVLDITKAEVIRIKRRLACESCLCPCYLQKVEIFAPPKKLIGSVHQTCSVIFPSFVVKNEKNVKVFRIKGPCCTYRICKDVEFKVISEDGQKEIGAISKAFSGVLKEAFTDADHFKVSFPLDLDVKLKATLIGALVLIDYMYYENTKTLLDPFTVMHWLSL
uniref:Phospholipid scramblase n=1 Tax=Graphocephala atropunctata TaxID=36148 RepID=A0A1B6KSJ6_9HEMI